MRVKNMFLNLFAVTIMTFANLGANINCIGIMYQPKFPGKANRKNSFS
ncbi:cyclic lactone autoinducer peptide [Anaerovirgula multivorans]|uniref:Cyclic lactone autoinducer peptide n=1 Tax=Anaerovirgula multivorans TaxID=312168 RepID=A0A239KZD7_9FIRM|nr:cyclic lactone autoinducer peptide [Anaerovirgula multivorans]SNT22849.1 cyclic lactone autoinducer peptide [Anaerovirgula multivorans]